MVWWVHCHPYDESIVIPMCCPHLESAGLWLPSTTGIHWNFIGAKVMQLHMLYTQTHTHNICRSAECSEARGCAVFSCFDLEWPKAFRSFCDTISPALRREHSQIWCLPQVWVPGCVCDDVGICSLFLLWPLLRMCQYTCITSTLNAWISFAKIKSGLYNSLLSSLVCGSWNTVQSCFFASFDNISHM